MHCLLHLGTSLATRAAIWTQECATILMEACDVSHGTKDSEAGCCGKHVLPPRDYLAVGLWQEPVFV